MSRIGREVPADDTEDRSSSGSLSRCDVLAHDTEGRSNLTLVWNTVHYSNKAREKKDRTTAQTDGDRDIRHTTV